MSEKNPPSGQPPRHPSSESAADLVSPLAESEAGNLSADPARSDLLGADSVETDSLSPSSLSPNSLSTDSLARGPESSGINGSDIVDAEASAGEAKARDRTAADLALFLPAGSIAQRQALEILARGKRHEKTRLVSLLLAYAEWDEIWQVIDEDQLRKLFPHLDLPSSLHRAWARFLGVPDAAEN